MQVPCMQPTHVLFKGKDLHVVGRYYLQSGMQCVVVCASWMTSFSVVALGVCKVFTMNYMQKLSVPF